MVSSPAQVSVNQDHAALCSSAEWAQHIAEVVLPQVLDGLDLGEDVLEIGPGYGASTAILADSVPSLTVVELDELLAAALAETYPGVTVVHGSGDRLPLGSGRFSAVVCFTMLHHVSSVSGQDALFAEARRVLMLGGVFAGSDSIASDDLHAFHAGDTYVPVDPDTLPQRLTAAGFGHVDVRIAPSDEHFAFSARN